ncbi:MAG: DUF4886 domain-containing protein [Vicingaceae bacterium]|nr:DUF4886 domain-containing protein [Vicingaceae bacterium]
MKRLIILLVTFTTLTAFGQHKKVLFIGNSYTYGNDLPTMLKTLAESFNDTIIKDQSTAGGSSLNAHTTNSLTTSKLNQGGWDFVIIQAQSQEPSFSPSQVASQTYPYAQALVNRARNNSTCVEPVFFMTWGRENGDASNCANYPPICTYNGMQQRLRESYLEMANDNSSTVAPVGVAWKTVRDSFPAIQLYTADGSHPNIYGSYLAACVFYATLFQKSPIGSSYIPTQISANDALNIQTIASNTVLDSMSLWRINTNKPIANFNYTGGNPINFTNNSTNGTSYLWEFGDGNTSTSQNPTHTYTSNGNYNVELTTYANDTCFSDITSQTINISATSIKDFNSNKNLTIYPNPAHNFIEIKTDLKYSSLSITDITGKVITNFNTESTINISNLKKGIYFIKVIGVENSIVRKFVKE